MITHLFEWYFIGSYSPHHYWGKLVCTLFTLAFWHVCLHFYCMCLPLFTLCFLHGLAAMLSSCCAFVHLLPCLSSPTAILFLCHAAFRPIVYMLVIYICCVCVWYWLAHMFSCSLGGHVATPFFVIRHIALHCGLLFMPLFGHTHSVLSLGWLYCLFFTVYLVKYCSLW